MSDFAQIRRSNLRGIGLTPTQLSERVKGRVSYWSEVISGSKSFGEKAARKVEEALGYPTGWMDQDHSAPGHKPDFPERSLPESVSTHAGGDVNIHDLYINTGPKIMTWRELAMSDLPSVFRVYLRNSVLAPKHLEGDYIKLNCELVPVAGDWVLIRTKDGEHHLRLFVDLGVDGWVGAPIRGDIGDDTITSKSGAEVVAVYFGGESTGRMSDGGGR